MSLRSGWPALAVSAVARLVLGTVVLLVAASVLPAVAGWQSSVVMSGSMAPTLEPGDLVVVRPVAPSQLTAGRIVLVDDPDVPGELRMHRIVAVEDGGLRLRGDANPQADGSLVAPAAVHGVGALRLPYLGLPALWARDGATGPLLLTGLALAALIALALLHRPAEDDGPARPPRWRRSPRLAALGAVTVVLAGLPGATGARAVFSSTAANSGNSLAAATYWSCGSAAATAGQYYPLQETYGTTAVNKGTLGAAANATYSSSGVSYAVGPGPRCAVGQDDAVWLDGSSGAIAANNAVTNPTTFTEQIWFATNTTSGGKLIGFGSSRTGASASYDRHVYMLNSGQLAFGVYDGATHVITSPRAYNDSAWHLVTATFSSSAGMTLYVDGVQVGRDSGSRTAQNFTGYWRIGYDNLNSWPNAPASYFFGGAIAHAAIFTKALASAEVAAQYGAGPWGCADAAGPNGAAAALYLPLGETSGTTAVNGGSAASAGNGTYAGTGVNHVLGGPSCSTDAMWATRLDGSSGQVWTTLRVSNPQTFTVQIWFATTTTTGGKLIGFGAAANGAQSSQFDRHIYMSNNGTLTFGVYNSGYYTVATPTAYNDGRWHLATGTFSPGTGLSFYVDGVLVGTNTRTAAAEVTTGYWRVGFDSTGGWPNAPSSGWFAGSVAQASVYYRALTADEVAGQYLAGS